jgi:hypothetical protein
MSQAHPDIPELQRFPEVVRSLIWMRAMMHAIRSPLTHVIGLASLVGAAGAGGLLGLWTAGPLGGGVGGCIGAGVAVYFFLRVVVESRARRLLPAVERDLDWRTEFADLISAQDRLARAAAALKNRNSS